MASSSRFGCSDGLMLAGRMSDRRNERRKRTPRVVQVAREGDSAYARCRDFSDTGMKLDLTAPLELNDVVTVALSPSIMLCGTVAWVRGRECGMVFDGPVDSDALLDAVGPVQTLLDVGPALRLLGERTPAKALFPSRADAESQSGAHFRAGLAVTVMVGPNEEQRGVVRWAKDNIAALEFADGSARAVPLPAVQ